MPSRTALLAGAVALALMIASPGALSPAERTAHAQPSDTPAVRVRYELVPECLRKSLEAPCDSPKSSKRLDFGPQIAIWVEKADGSYVDTLLVTNATAVRGIGNRPGYWRFPSNWHFPYGKRTMALPIWAHKRGHLYDTLIIQDDDGTNEREKWLGFHESVSSPDPYYCLSFRSASWVMDAESVDAISCPTGMFNSSKGRLSTTEPRSFYPPRNDLSKVTPTDCDVPSQNPCSSVSASRFAELNDLDAVATATPPYGQALEGVWQVPNDLPDGAYVLVVEVNKEFDVNSFHNHEAYQDPRLPDNGIRTNFGQPSVVYRAPFDLDRMRSHQAVATAITGYGDWDGATGNVHPPDATLSTDYGSGAGRLRTISRPSVEGGMPISGVVHVTTELPLRPEDCVNLPPDNGVVGALTIDTVTATGAVITFIEAADRGRAVERYEIRYTEGNSMTPDIFRQATPASSVSPKQPNVPTSLTLMQLKPLTSYVIGVRVRGGCVNEGPIASATFTTPALQFTQLHGCFVATAAYGSAMEPQIESLRHLRDRVRTASAFGAATIGLYERSSPPVAAVLRESEAGRALIREALAPLVTVIDAAESAFGRAR